MLRNPRTPRLKPGMTTVLIALIMAFPAQGQDFTINLRALGGADNPHPPIPQCQLVEEHDPPYPDSTGDCLHGLATSNGQPIECIEAGIENCPVLTIGVPSPGIMYATTVGMGVVDYDISEPLACPLNCSPSWLLGEDCGTVPGDPCFCDINGCVGTPSGHEDWKDGLDFTHLNEPSGERIRIRLGVPVLITDFSVWLAGFSQMILSRSDCPGPLLLHNREGEIDGSDGRFTASGGGFYLPANAAVEVENPEYRPNSTNDRVAIQEFGVTSVNRAEQPSWRTSCQYFSAPLDRGFVDIFADQWVRTDDDNRPGTDIWTSTSNVSTANCGLDNLTGGAAGAACFQSDPGRSGFDTSLISRSLDLSFASFPVLRFVLNLQSQDEEVEVYTSDDAGVTWTLRWERSASTNGGMAFEVALPEHANSPDIKLRFRYHDPNDTDSNLDFAILDDLSIYSLDGLFADGFESGSTSSWSVP